MDARRAHPVRLPYPHQVLFAQGLREAEHATSVDLGNLPSPATPAGGATTAASPRPSPRAHARPLQKKKQTMNRFNFFGAPKIPQALG